MRLNLWEADFGLDNGVHLKAGKKGQLIIDPRAYHKLPPELKEYYGPEEVIRSKNGEKYKAHRCTFIATNGDDNSWLDQIRESIHNVIHVHPWWHNHH